jgi:hypothetical protein
VLGKKVKQKLGNLEGKDSNKYLILNVKSIYWYSVLG